MICRRLTYAVVTPCRNEGDNLPRLADSLISQTHLPEAWVIVDNGSTDATPAVASRLAGEHPWIRVATIPGDAAADRGGAVVRAFQHGLSLLGDAPEIVVNVDADISMQEDYFERLIGAFAKDDALGIASGSAFERRRGGEWRRRHCTRDSVWGASRAYRRACLDQVLPLEERVGWDGVDEVKANARGWTTKTLLDLPFRHHRPEGARDGAPRRAWAEQGRLAHYIHYRLPYLLLRVGYRCLRDPAALAMIGGYARAVMDREPRCDDREAVAYLRHEQALRRIPIRIGEALGVRLS